MRTSFQRPGHDWSRKELEDFFMINMGGQTMWNKLTGEIGLPKETLGQLLQDTIGNGEAADFAGGQEVIDMLPPRMRDGMLLVSALRKLVHDFDPDHGKETFTRNVPEPPSGPVSYGKRG